MRVPRPRARARSVPGAGSRPAIGTVGEIEVVRRAPGRDGAARDRRDAAVIAALRTAHPYEEPAFDVLELAAWPGERGTGRVGRLRRADDPCATFADRSWSRAPADRGGRAGVGRPRRHGRARSALVGGAGDFMLDAARAAGVDVFVTSDLRHHPASELREYAGAPALVDVPHWAAEWTWLPRAAQALTHRLAERGTRR